MTVVKMTVPFTEARATVVSRLGQFVTFLYSGDKNYVGMGGPGGTSTMSKPVPEETITAAELGVPVRHAPGATARGRVIYAKVGIDPV